MEALTAAKKKELRMLGTLDGLRRARDALLNCGVGKSAEERVRKAIDFEIDKIMTLPENDF